MSTKNTLGRVKGNWANNVSWSRKYRETDRERGGEKKKSKMYRRMSKVEDRNEIPPWTEKKKSVQMKGKLPGPAWDHPVHQHTNSQSPRKRREEKKSADI